MGCQKKDLSNGKTSVGRFFYPTVSASDNLLLLVVNLQVLSEECVGIA